MTNDHDTLHAILCAEAPDVGTVVTAVCGAERTYDPEVAGAATVGCIDCLKFMLARNNEMTRLTIDAVRRLADVEDIINRPGAMDDVTL